ncbi:MAG: Flp family type IVb pilin [Chloroflexi bacterium]|nr:Flp family type IVb pilin [Chloroflexota bacterium]
MKENQKQTEGQGLVEYALVLVMVAIVVMGVLILVGPQIGNIFSRLLEPSYCGGCICGTSLCN